MYSSTADEITRRKGFHKKDTPPLSPHDRILIYQSAVTRNDSSFYDPLLMRRTHVNHTKRGI